MDKMWHVDIFNIYYFQYAQIFLIVENEEPIKIVFPVTYSSFHNFIGCAFGNHLNTCK